MSDYAPGMRVIIRNEEWMVKLVEENSLGGKTLHCVGISALVKDHPAVFLADLEEIVQVDPAKVQFVVDDSSFFRRSRLFMEGQWRRQTPTDEALHVGHRAAMDLMPYQLDPAQMSLKRPRQRILIADAVGLGKTLEAGILLSELIARGKGRRILVVTVKSMMMQFQKEMWNRFTIPLVRLDAERIQRVRAQLPTNHNPLNYYDKAIVSIDTLKRDREYRTYLEDAYWDIIVIDEAHNVAARGSTQAQRARLADLLSKRSDTLIMLSATPHDGKAESFASLMLMLDPTSIANKSDYRREDVKGLCVRRFKKDIKSQILGAFPERIVSIENCEASEAEETAFGIFAEMKLEMDADKTAIAGQLFKTGLEKAMFSSPAACIASIRERLKKLHAKFGADGIADIGRLEQFKESLERITPDSFSRYRQLLHLLRDPAYGWNPVQTADRIVIFTERIETMHFLRQQLMKDLNMKEEAIREIHGGMHDSDQIKLVDAFGRDEAPLRVLVASDVASEGLNLHYLCHRLIHFDIPWSLMVFQQRNGRVDRYGQTRQPDIRYFLINSRNERIHGDMRIMKILVTKEEQAYKNIGDPAQLMGKFNVEEEEQLTATAMENGMGADAFDASLEKEEAEFNPFEMLMRAAEEMPEPVVRRDAETLLSDLEYLRLAMQHFSENERIPMQSLRGVNGLEITLHPELRRRLAAVLPDEALPDTNLLRLSPDKAFCMEEMKRCMQNDMAESAWPTTQFLWALHPIFEWVGDKTQLLFGRGEAPLIGLTEGLETQEMIFVVAGLIPNRKSTPVVNEWFGLRYMDGVFAGMCSMSEVLVKTRFNRMDMPNTGSLPRECLELAQHLLPEAIAEAERVMKREREAYLRRIDPKINEELDKLGDLQNRHLQAIHQMTLPGIEAMMSEEERRVICLFNTFIQWVRDTLEIQDRPYLKVIAAFTGVRA